MENNLKYYGNECNVIAEILLSRHDIFTSKKIQTHITTNLSASEIENNYGNRVRSRLRELCNLIAYDISSPSGYELEESYNSQPFYWGSRAINLQNVFQNVFRFSIDWLYKLLYAIYTNLWIFQRQILVEITFIILTILKMYVQLYNTKLPNSNNYHFIDM